MSLHRWRSRLPVLSFLGALLLTASAHAAENTDPALAELRRLTAYDAKAPLDVQVIRTEKRGDVTVTELTYASPLGGPVPAYLVTPPGAGPFPAVLFQHWGEGTKNEFLDEALSLARAGAVSLLVDGPFVRPEPWRKPAFGPQVGELWKQALVDLRRGVDLLSARPEVDGKRLAYVGHSFGASVGGSLAGLEPRLRAFVLMAGLGDFTDVMRTGTGPVATWWRKNTPKAQLEAFLQRVEPFNGAVGVRHAAPAALFFQYPRADEYIPYERAWKYIQAGTEPKLFKFYEGGHELNEAARRDRVQWLRTHLGFAELPSPSLPVIAEPAITAPEWKALPTPEWSKLRPVSILPGMEEVEVRRGITYARVGERELKLDVYIPDVSRRRTVPAVVLVHGALHPALLRFLRDMRSFSGLARWLAANGLIVVVPELGSPASGPAPEQHYTGVGELVTRVQDALAFARKEAATYRIDPEKLCLMTLSAGGLWGLVPVLKDPPPYLKCAVAWYPVLETQPAQPKERDPLELLRAAKKPLPPLLLVRAGRDAPALNTAVDAFVKEARRRKAPFTLIDLPEAHHAFELFDDTETSRDAMRKTGAFLNQQLGP